MVTMPRMAYPAVRTTKDDNVIFSFLQRCFTSDQAEALECRSFCARRRRSLYAANRKKETLNVLLLLEKSQIRNVRRTSKHFPMKKIDFLPNNVVLTIRTMTVSRNATNNIRTESERLVTDLGLCAISRFRGGGRNFKPPYLRNG